VSLISKNTPGAINVIALSDILLKNHSWITNKTIRPAGLHLAITQATCYDWKEFVKVVKDSVLMMKEQPELNHNSNVATYGMAA
jgi:hypothetical protein